jgi:hypothetical protein
VWFARFVAVPVRDWLAWWFYWRRWKAAMTLAGLAPDYRGQPVLPVLGKVHQVGRHVRISESALSDFIDAGRVEPLTAASTRHKMRGVA